MDDNNTTSALKSFRQRGVNNSFWGRTHSEESKLAISNSMKQYHKNKTEAENN